MSYFGTGQNPHDDLNQPGRYDAGRPLGATHPGDLTLPLYGATFGQAVVRFFRSYIRFRGRASLSEFWWSALFMILLAIIPAIIYTAGMVTSLESGSSSLVVQTPATQMSPMATLGDLLMWGVSLATVIPSASIGWRRLHDANLPGPLYLLTLIPFVGAFIVIALMIMPTKPEGRRFDAKPQAF